MFLFVILQKDKSATVLKIDLLTRSQIPKWLNGFFLHTYDIFFLSQILRCRPKICLMTQAYFNDTQCIKFHNAYHQKKCTQNERSIYCEILTLERACKQSITYILGCPRLRNVNFIRIPILRYVMGNPLQARNVISF